MPSRRHCATGPAATRVSALDVSEQCYEPFAYSTLSFRSELVDGKVPASVLGWRAAGLRRVQLVARDRPVAADGWHVVMGAVSYSIDRGVLPSGPSRTPTSRVGAIQTIEFALGPPSPVHLRFSAAVDGCGPSQQPALLDVGAIVDDPHQ